MHHLLNTVICIVLVTLAGVVFFETGRTNVKKRPTEILALVVIVGVLLLLGLAGLAVGGGK